MNRKWTDILDGSNDDSIGSALVRLARMAADVHELESLSTEEGDDLTTDAPVAIVTRTAAHPMAVDLPLTLGGER